MADTPWDADALNAQRVRLMVAHGATDRAEGVVCVDDTGLPKQGQRSVGVQRQYCGELGKIANCQVVVTAHYRAPHTHWPLGTRLYLPERWAHDPARRAAAHVPAAVAFATKPELALGLVDAARARAWRTRRSRPTAAMATCRASSPGWKRAQEPYIVQVSKTFGVRRPTEVLVASLRTPPATKPGRPPASGRIRSSSPRLETAQAVIAAVPGEPLAARCGSSTPRGSPTERLACRVRVHRAHGGVTGPAGLAARGAAAAGRSRRPEMVLRLAPGSRRPLEDQLRLAHRRWSVERFHQDGKQELGLGDYQGRSWAGLHRHLALVCLIWSYAVLQAAAQHAPAAGAFSPWAQSPGGAPARPGPTRDHHSLSPLSGARPGAHPRGGTGSATRAPRILTE